jgi:hypothetical protein
MEVNAQESFLMFLAENTADEFEGNKPVIGPDTLQILFENGFDDLDSIAMSTVEDLA